ncbi:MULTISPECIES: hypothetical protein [unclassified Mesorhizobium]|uniref:hypothetical protein n=1 Tax=unclassified Mesorhizobium TaxID=325217 RepID=UPI000FDB1F00|nr:MULTISPECIES: hypothetical protein [unclassified Mesorhizobium]TGT76738.1 hypothetical protein EN809_003805 [Mesorhizobium sp. M2E.F.Ca.ET.166.01.1.1]TGW02850.1 hypothetical protein EN797_003805 [Mesorhizobium sp. M2E.F.Ca.ET.154.01.1.1]
MNLGEIAELFIRAAEIDRNTHEHVGPAALRAQQLPYVHSWSDKLGWRKEVGDKLDPKADLLAEERKAFWERVASMPTAAELSLIDSMFDWLKVTDDDAERRALWAWARSKAGGKSFRRWCFQVEGIHPETGRRRKDRAIQRISDHLAGKRHLHNDRAQIRVLQVVPQISDISATLAEDVGQRDGLNSWLADDAFAPFMVGIKDDFSWAAKRNERRRQQAAKQRAA